MEQMSNRNSEQPKTNHQPPTTNHQFYVRDARRSDVETIVAMWRELMTLHGALDPRFAIAPDGENIYKRHIEEMLRSRDGRVLLAEAIESGEAVGYMQGELLPRSGIAPPGLYGLISDVFVRDNWRQRGVGRALFVEMRRWFVERKVQTMQLYVAAANPDAQAFWESVGMRPYMVVLQQELSPPDPPSSPLSPGQEDKTKRPDPKWHGLFRTRNS
jgi:GNAT superfamily N-acetyltransferase